MDDKLNISSSDVGGGGCYEERDVALTFEHAVPVIDLLVKQRDQLFEVF
jgi:hypothetical protein